MTHVYVFDIESGEYDDYWRTTEGIFSNVENALEYARKFYNVNYELNKISKTETYEVYSAIKHTRPYKTYYSIYTQELDPTEKQE